MNNTFQIIENELVVAFVAAVGVNLVIAEEALRTNLEQIGYSVEVIKITRTVLPQLFPVEVEGTTSDFHRIGKMMDLGNKARKDHGTDILAKGVIAAVSERRQSREGELKKNIAYIVHSLKHPEEVLRLRNLYQDGFYLIGVHADPEIRKKHLMETRNMEISEAKILMDRDRKERFPYGQHVVDTFHLSDFFIGWSGDDKIKIKQGALDLGSNSVTEKESTESINEKRVIGSINRFVEIILGHPYKTPTFGEYAMFMAFAASLRSSDLSRQVGAVVARKGEILSTGANDCPAAGGGLYWPKYNDLESEILDYQDGRDYMRGFDSNRKEQDDLIKKILETITEDFGEDQLDLDGLEMLKRILEKSPIRNLTEYGRVVHAEMEALLACARKGVSTIDATIYCTTFPCHNCAKHIIAAGIKRVVFVEPYLKSKAIDFHKDSIRISYPQGTAGSGKKETVSDDRVKFEPFYGVGPRRFFDLFSMNHGAGPTMIRKDSQGRKVDWAPEDKAPRIPLSSVSFLEKEVFFCKEFSDIIGSQPI